MFFTFCFANKFLNTNLSLSISILQSFIFKTVQYIGAEAQHWALPKSKQ